MPVIVNDLTIEPTVTPPRQATEFPAGSGGGAKSGPELERAVETLRRREMERALRLWAH